MDRIPYQGWQNCVRLSNGEVELIATADVGPRIMRFGFIGAENEFVEFPDDLGKTGGSVHRMYGGHRLWHAPEDMVRTYVPDNDPLTVQELDGGGVRLTQPMEKTTFIQKEMDVTLVSKVNEVMIIHRMYNRGLWPVSLALWGLTQMARGGVGIFPLPPRGSHSEHLLPSSRLAIWAYTDMSDPRWTWGKQFILLQQDPQQAAPQKFGFTSKDGWMAYARKGHLFVKYFPPVEEKHYPDLGVNAEAFTNDEILELETLSPLVNVAPGESVEHIERWLLVKGIKEVRSEADVVREVLPIIRRNGKADD